jgi:hypothetical protein
MPTVNLYTPEDLADVKRVFESHDLGLDPKKYPLPDFDEVLIRSKIVTRTREGRFIGMAYTRALVETAIVMDPGAGTRKERMVALWALHEGTRRDLVEKGYDRAIAFVAPKPEGFVSILEGHGWRREEDRQTLYYNF